MEESCIHLDRYLVFQSTCHSSWDDDIKLRVYIICISVAPINEFATAMPPIEMHSKRTISIDVSN